MAFRSTNIALRTSLAVLLCFAVLAACDDPTASPAPVSSEAPAAAADASPTGASAGSAAGCDEDAMREKNDCCMQFEEIAPPSTVDELVKKVLETENMKNNKTMWSLESVESAMKKECAPDIYKVKAKVLKTPRGENGTVIDCQMRFRHATSSPLSADMAATAVTPQDGAEEDGDAAGGKITVDLFCNASTRLTAAGSLLVGGAASLLALVAAAAVSRNC